MPDSKNILICRCKHDDKVKYPFCWAELIKEEAEDKGIKVIDLKEENYTEENFKNMIEQFDPFFVFCNGHGNLYSTKGHKDCCIIEACKNDILLRGRIAYLLSCDTVRILGKSAVNKGCPFYIGYTSKFKFPITSPEPDDLLDDPWARGFMKASNQIPLTILNGGAPEEAYENSQKEFDKWIKYWESQEIEGASFVASFLRNAKNSQVMRIG